MSIIDHCHNILLEKKGEEAALNETLGESLE